MRRAALAAVLALALAVRLWVLRSLRFDGLYGQDAFAYYYHGLAIWRDHALSYHWPWLPGPLPLFFPIGEPALLAAVFAVLGRPDATAALGVSVACGIGSVALVYSIALRIADLLFEPLLATWTAVLAAAPIALAGLQVQASDTIMSDAPALLWGMSAIWLWTLPAPREHGRASLRRAMITAFAAGVCYALAVSTRWEYAALALGMVAYWWAGLDHVHHPHLRATPALLGALLAGIPQFLYSLHNSDPVLRHQWLIGWSPANLWQATFATVDGVQHYPMSAGMFYLVRPLLSPQSLPFTLAPFLPLGIVALAGGGTFTAEARRRGDDAEEKERQRGRTGHVGDDEAGSRQWLLLLLGWWLAPVLYLAGVPFESARFTLIYTPPLAILEAAGVVATVRALAGMTIAAWPGSPTGAAYPIPPDRERSWRGPDPEGSGGRHPTRGAGSAAAVPAGCAPLRRSRVHPPWWTAEAWVAALRWRLGTGGPAIVAIVWAALGLGIQAADARDGVAALARGKEGDQAAISWLRGHTSPNATIATFGLTLMLYHYGDLAGHRWSLLDLSAADTADLARAARSPALTVVVNEGNLAAQWRGLPPQRAFAWLQAHARLRPVAGAGGYTIFSQGAG